MSQQVEARLVNEYLFENFRFKPQWKRVRLGPLPNKEMAAAFSVTLRWVDAIVIDGGEVILVEAKMSPDAGAFGQLELYEQLFRDTPEFFEYKNAPIKKLFLTTQQDLRLMDMARQKGIEYAIFRPAWIKEWEARRFRLK